LLEWILGIITVILFAIVLWLAKSKKELKELYKQAISDKHRVATVHGLINEQFLPFLKNFPYDPENFRFIGKPVDGVCFEDDRIVFLEFKSGSSQLTSIQNKIKSLVEDKKVEFQELRLE